MRLLTHNNHWAFNIQPIERSTGNNTWWYLNDVIGFSVTFDEHNETEDLAKFKLAIKLEKNNEHRI